MLRIEPPPLDESLPGPPFLRYLSASWHMLNVPTASISKTAQNQTKKVFQIEQSKDKLLLVYFPSRFFFQTSYNSILLPFHCFYFLIFNRNFCNSTNFFFLKLIVPLFLTK